MDSAPAARTHGAPSRGAAATAADRGPPRRARSDRRRIRGCRAPRPGTWSAASPTASRPRSPREVRSAGGARAWFEHQLDPASIPDPDADALDAWWPEPARSASRVWKRQINGVEGGWEVMADYQRWVLLRRMQSPARCSR